MKTNGSKQGKCRGLLLGDDARVASWAFRAFNLTPTPFNVAIGIVDPDGKLAGAALFQSWNGFNLEISYYGKRTFTLGILRALARAAVNFNPSRLTATTSKKNRKFIRGLQKIGFRLEGAQRRYFGMRDCPRNTGVRLVMFREQLDKIAGVQVPEKVVVAP